MSEVISLLENPRWRDYVARRSNLIGDVFDVPSLPDRLSSRLDLWFLRGHEKIGASSRNPVNPLQKKIPSESGVWARHPDRYDEGIELLSQGYADHPSAHVFLFASHLRDGDGVLSGLAHEIWQKKVFLKVDLLNDDLRAASRAFRLSRSKQTDGLISERYLIKDAVAHPSAIVFDSFDGEILSTVDFKFAQSATDTGGMSFH